MTDNIKPFFITFWSGKALQELLFTGTRWTKPHCAGVTYLLSCGNISSLQFAPELISCDPSTFTFFTLSAISSFPFSWSCDNFTETAGFALLFLLSEPFLTYHQYEHIWPQAIHITQLFLFPNGEHCVSTKMKTWILLPLMQFMWEFSWSTFFMSLRTALLLGWTPVAVLEVPGLFSSEADLFDLLDSAPNTCFLSCFVDGCRGGNRPDEPNTLALARARVIRILCSSRWKDPCFIFACLIEQKVRWTRWHT